jgi:cell division protein FtsB
MKLLAAILGSLVVLVQYPLWLGKGGWLRVWEVERQLAEDRSRNQRLQFRNAALAAEVRDLKEGLEAIEERARFEQGMVKKDEIFFQIIEPQKRAPAR